MKKVYLTVKQQLNHLTKEECLILRELCHFSKNLYNEALYNVKQHYIKEKKYLNYDDNKKLLKTSRNYINLNAHFSLMSIKRVDDNFKSFFRLLKDKKEGKYMKNIEIPNYLSKYTLALLTTELVRITKKNTLTIPYSKFYEKDHKRIKIRISKDVIGKNVKEIKIIPKLNGRFFEIQYTYLLEEESKKLNEENALAIDLGINNLATCVTNMGKSFIIDGRKLKSINQLFNKKRAYFQSKGKEKTNKFYKNILKRNNKVNDYINKSARMIINYCLSNDIGNLVLGYNKDFQKRVKFDKINNQNFLNIPFGRFRKKIESLCNRYGINFKLQEESYTSLSSFWDKDILPEKNKNNYKKTYKFSGKRIKRGLYQTSKGYVFNSDVNGALNILRKSKVVDLDVLYNRGKLDTPIRKRIM